MVQGIDEDVDDAASCRAFIRSGGEVGLALTAKPDGERRGHVTKVGAKGPVLDQEANGGEVEEGVKRST